MKTVPFEDLPQDKQERLENIMDQLSQLVMDIYKTDQGDQRVLSTSIKFDVQTVNSKAGVPDELAHPGKHKGTYVEIEDGDKSRSTHWITLRANPWGYTGSCPVDEYLRSKL